MPLPGARLPAALQDRAPSAGLYARQAASELPPAKALSVELIDGPNLEKILPLRVYCLHQQ